MRVYLIDKYDRLLRNETQIIKNTVMQNKVGKLSQLVIIENSGGDCDADAQNTQANGRQMKQFFRLITLIVVVKRIMMIRTMKMI